MTTIDLFEQVEGESRQHGSYQPAQSSRVHPSDSLNFNQAYAQTFERRKRGEELMKLKDKYGSDYEPSESEEDFSSEDSDAEFVTPEVDAAILKTLARIKKQDPKLLHSQGNVFEEEEAQNAIARAQQLKRDKSTLSSNRQRPMHLRDYQRQALLHNQNQESDQDEFPPEHCQPTPAEEAAALREEMKQAFHALVDDDDIVENGDDDDVQNLLVLRDKHVEESEEEEEEYQRFLVEQVGSEDIQTALKLNSEVQQQVRPQENGSARNTQEDDEFLRSYVLGRGWIDREAKKIPKYKEIVNANAQPSRSKYDLSGSNAVDLGRTMICDEHDEEDEEFVEKAEEFEADYNFRFENDATVITHARDTGPTARRKDESRKQARETLKSRKDEEKQQRMEELRRMQELKKTEIKEKLEIIRKNAGAEDCNLDDIDLDSDFDPESHDRRMGKVFDNGFYSKTDPDGKPVWEDDIEIDDIVPARVPPEEEEEEEEVNFEPGGDAYDPSVPGKKLSKKMKRLAKKQKKQHDGGLDNHEDEQELEQNQDTIDLEGLSPKSRKQKLMEALDDYHKLDFEDMIGDLPTRFKYTNTEATEWMTPEQILLATDAELNQVIGLKKLAPYRTLSNDKKLANRKKKLKELRKKLKSRKWGEASNDNNNGNPQQLSTTIDILMDGTSEPPAKKRKGKKERKKLKEGQEQQLPMELDQQES